MATAIQLGLVPGFALQNGDLLAELISGGGTVPPGAMFGLGSTANPSQGATGNNSFANAAQLTSSISIIPGATATNNSVKLAEIGIGTVMRIYNTSAQLIWVFPPVSFQFIDGNPAGQAVPLSGDARCDYLYLGLNAWISDLLGSASE